MDKETTQHIAVESTAAVAMSILRAFEQSSPNVVQNLDKYQADIITLDVVFKRVSSIIEQQKLIQIAQTVIDAAQAWAQTNAANADERETEFASTIRSAIEQINLLIKAKNKT